MTWVLNTLNILNNALLYGNAYKSVFGMHTRYRRLIDYVNIFDYNVCCRLLGLVVLVDAVAAEGTSVEEHGEDDDDDDEEEEREDDDGDVGHDLDAAVAHLHHLQ